MRIAAVLLLFVAACRPAPQPLAPPVSVPFTVDTPAPAPAPTPVATLAGEWRVAGVDGREVQGSVGIALRGNDRELWWEPRCAGLVRSYRIEGTLFSTGPYLGFKPRQPGDPTPPVCAIGLPPGLQQMFAALDAATHIVRTPNNGVELSGGEHSLLLFSQ